MASYVRVSRSLLCIYSRCPSRHSNLIFLKLHCSLLRGSQRARAQCTYAQYMHPFIFAVPLFLDSDFVPRSFALIEGYLFPYPGCSPHVDLCNSRGALVFITFQYTCVLQPFRILCYTQWSTHFFHLILAGFVLDAMGATTRNIENLSAVLAFCSISFSIHWGSINWI